MAQRFPAGFADWQPGEAGGSTVLFFARAGHRIPEPAGGS
jgi:hypothetical protein